MCHVLHEALVVVTQDRVCRERNGGLMSDSTMLR